MSFRYASLHEFLLDQNLSPALAALLAEAGHDTVHVRDLDLSRASDERVMSRAVADDRVLVSSDTDFGEPDTRRRDRRAAAKAIPQLEAAL